ncbi:mannosyltransferase [Nakamurella panacisegetis]|uniref:mannosyltransferase n=1 Tax=Nakamurella panacisegetis TaxID=1090615 RepID=UPI0012FE3666|nr:mannosyltransferase [Nakamurella panacisegetis]
MLVALPARLVASRWAPWMLLVLSVGSRVVITLAGTSPYNMIDLKVYVEGARHLTGGSLYDFVSGASQLPFTYPPFSALVFTPLAWLPWTVVRVLWQLAMLASLPAIVYLTLRLLGRAGPGATDPVRPLRGFLVVATALAFWLEPVTTTVGYGQINLFLVLMVLGAAVTAKDLLAGAGVGLAAGIKLIPAVTGLYWLVQRRIRALILSVVFFLATVAVMFAMIPAETRRYFTKLIFDPSRTGPVFSAINQSWRGALSRLAGHDVSAGWVVACVVTVVLGVWAAVVAAGVGDRAAALLAAQFLGLLVSPISWSHHWVWVIPLLIWGFFGPQRQSRAVRGLMIGWLIALYSYLIPFLVALQGKVPSNSRPGWQSWLGTAYVVLGVATLIVIGVVGRSSAAPVEAPGRGSGPRRGVGPEAGNLDG